VEQPWRIELESTIYAQRAVGLNPQRVTGGGRAFDLDSLQQMRVANPIKRVLAKDNHPTKLIL